LFAWFLKKKPSLKSLGPKYLIFFFSEPNLLTFIVIELEDDEMDLESVVVVVVFAVEMGSGVVLQL
jgi:hypothetical protein